MATIEERWAELEQDVRGAYAEMPNERKLEGWLADSMDVARALALVAFRQGVKAGAHDMGSVETAEKIEVFLTEAELAEMEHSYSKQGEDGRVVRLVKELAAERSDLTMLAMYVSEVYDDVTGGRVSKPLTLPSVVLEFANEERDSWTVVVVKEALEEKEDDFQRALALLERAQFNNCCYPPEVCDTCTAIEAFRKEFA